MDVASNINRVSKRILLSVNKYNRDQDDITLVCVSKTKPKELIEKAYGTGCRHFGESYLDEAIGKIEALHEYAICWHFIGAIQSKKCKFIARYFDWVHSVASLKVAKKLSQHRSSDIKPLNIMIQINVDTEASKSGVLIEEAISLFEEIHQLPNLRVRGFMTLPAKRTGFAEQKAAFDQIAKLSQDVKRRFPLHSIDSLSMGMSGDLEAAIAAGSTHVRIGTDIFGPREYIKANKVSVSA